MFNERQQDSFAPFAYEASSMNLHRRNSLKEVNVVVVFVHGLMGSGYRTWQNFPRYLFDSVSPEGPDVAIFDYNSGHRRRLNIRPNISDVAVSLSQYIAGLRERYEHIYIAAHSLGGLVTQMAIQNYLDVHDRQTNSLKALAGVILFASPLEGSRWASRFFSLVFAEAKLLRKHSSTQREIHDFIFNKVQTENLSHLGDREYQFVVYSAYGDFDRLVSKASATLGVLDKQCKSFVEGHSSLVKPKSPDSPQCMWMQDVIGNASRNRELVRFELRQQVEARRVTMAPRRGPSGDQDRLIAELYREIDGHDFWDVYLRALNDSSTDLVRVFDRTEFRQLETATELLMCVTDSKNVENRRSDTWGLISAAHGEYSKGRSSVRIVTVGGTAESAKLEIIENFSDINPTQGSRNIFVSAAIDSVALYRQLRSFFAVFVSRMEDGMANPPGGGI